MTDQLISPETAILATELNCPLEIYGKGYEYTDEEGNEYWTTREGGISGTEKTTPVVKCTQSLLQRWLRESLPDWCILVYVVPHISDKPILQQCHIWNRGVLTSIAPQDTYEEALELGLQAALRCYNQSRNTMLQSIEK